MVDARNTTKLVILALTGFILLSYLVQAIFGYKLFAYGLLINAGIIFALVAFLANYITKEATYTKQDLISFAIITIISIVAIFVLPHFVPQAYSVLQDAGIATSQSIMGIPFTP